MAHPPIKLGPCAAVAEERQLQNLTQRHSPKFSCSSGTAELSQIFQRPYTNTQQASSTAPHPKNESMPPMCLTATGAEPRTLPVLQYVTHWHILYVPKGQEWKQQQAGQKQGHGSAMPTACVVTAARDCYQQEALQPKQYSHQRALGHKSSRLCACLILSGCWPQRDTTHGESALRMILGYKTGPRPLLVGLIGPRP
eukprot:1160590-Pelagomonas_calceolata.AAC.9